MKVSQEFNEAYTALNCKTPNHEPKATESIDEIIDLIKLLEDKEIAYQTSSGVYFDISKFYIRGLYKGLNNALNGFMVPLALVRFMNRLEDVHRFVRNQGVSCCHLF